ncbi:nucleotidyltransferase domain-containing protein [Thermoflexus sp.]|uniref:nucleotidyltransferase domain-containing protein n=1 Tax=Thermoflexus sp. TaxID=1969742 RepID=UPI002ADE60DE|nr:nucleotidyltransferase domain-containing protein [Thermoflexus sp.]
MGVRERYARRPPMPPDVIQRLAGLEALFRRHPVRLAYLFGSIARGDPCAADVDLAVLPEEDLSLPQLYADLSLALGTDRLDLVALRSAPPGLQPRRCLFARSEVERQTFEQRVRDTARDARARILA